MFRDQREVIVLDADRERFGNVNVIESLRRFRALFQLLEFCRLDRRDRNQLQLNQLIRAGIDRLVIDRRAGPADFPARFAGAKAVMLEKRRGFHIGDGPAGTVLTIATAAELREAFLPTAGLGTPV